MKMKCGGGNAGGKLLGTHGNAGTHITCGVCFLSLTEERSHNLEGDRQADPLGNSRHLPLLPG